MTYSSERRVDLARELARYPNRIRLLLKPNAGETFEGK
jgi:hypothetical protein